MSLTKILPELRAIVGGVVVFLGLKIGKYFLAGLFLGGSCQLRAHIYKQQFESSHYIPPVFEGIQGYFLEISIVDNCRYKRHLKGCFEFS